MICLVTLPVSTWSQANAPMAVAGEYIIKFKPRIVGNSVHAKMNSRFSSLRAGLPLEGMYRINATDKKAIEQLQSDPDVEYIEPNFILSKASEENPGQIVEVLNWQQMTSLHTNSSGFQALDFSGQSFGLYDQSGAAVRATDAWAQSSAYAAGNRPVVAIIDTGVDRNHYIFTQTHAIWTNTGEIAGNNVDDDFNGYVDDVNGWNFVSNSNNPNDDENHGTHVAGIVLGATMDVLNTPPLTQNSKILIMPVKFLNSSGSGTTSAAINSIYYAVNNGAKVINCSWGGGSYSRALHDAITYAYTHGALVVTAAGNNHANNDLVDMYPANYDVPSNISIAATSDSDSLASFSNYGNNRVGIASPGVLIYSSLPGGSFGLMSGTSMAAPFVAGIAALAWREAPQLTGYQMRSMLIATGDTKAALAGKIMSQSRVNAYALVQEAKTQSSTTASQPSYTPSYKAERSVASSNGASSSGAPAACGLVASVLKGQGPGPMDGPTAGMLVGLLLLPVLLWLALRKPAAKYNRQFDRFKMNSDIKLKIGEREIVGHLNTISVGGLGFDVDAALERGGTVTMKVASPDGKEQIEVQGHIVWNENNKSYGVQFDEAKDSIVSRIQDWTKSLVKAN